VPASCRPPARACGHATLHARAQQFASRVTGRLFTLGMQFWQLGEAHYWGHNAIIRVEPFMKHCGLGTLPGTGALAGEILSHDFVEAALMRRAGYEVWLVGDLEGSYEQQPPHLLAELQRDRRWCQGNLQNARLIAEPGLKGVHRAMLATGAMSCVGPAVAGLCGAGRRHLDEQQRRHRAHPADPPQRDHAVDHHRPDAGPAARAGRVGRAAPGEQAASVAPCS
jgi:membrane glycosyltransferase